MIEDDIINEKLISTYDRLQEAQWNLHQMKLYYHEADLFRFSVNSFLRVLKEVPQILRMELQNETGFKVWFNEKSKLLFSDPLMRDFFDKRNNIVHKKMLVHKSKACVGISGGRGIKLGGSWPLNPLEDSDLGMVKYLRVISETEFDLFCILDDDEESFPCIIREWKIESFDDDLVTLCEVALKNVYDLFLDTVKWLGGENTIRPTTSEYYSKHLAFRIYERDWLRLIFDQLSEKSDADLVIMLKDLRRIS